MDQNAQQGVPIEIMIKIKPEPQQRIDLKIYENKILYPVKEPETCFD